MVEQVDSKVIENKGIAGLGTQISESFKSVLIKRLVEKSTPKGSLSSLAVLGRDILPSAVLSILKANAAGVYFKIQLTDVLDELVKVAGLNAFETDSGVLIAVIKEGS